MAKTFWAKKNKVGYSAVGHKSDSRKVSNTVED